ncbi:CapA family protein [Chloroflexota bacterium]
MADKDKVVTLMAAGDNGRGNYDSIRSTLKEGDITFGQLESLLSVRGTQQLFIADFHQVFSGRGMAPLGSVQRTISEVEAEAKALVDAGFDIMSFASNHTMDKSEDAMLDTLDLMHKNNIVVIGAGKNIGEARRPAIIESKGTRVGFLAYCSVIPPGYHAMENRGGVAPVRATTAYQQIDWQAGSPPRIITITNPEDLAGMVEDIEKLRPLVDVLVVSMHWGVHFVPALIADYQFEAGHAAIDAGADIIIGHHAHILKGIEVYKGKVIFFSLGNFSMPPRKFTPISAAGRYWVDRFGVRSETDPEHPTYPYPMDSQKTMLVKCEIANKKIQRVAYLPLWINKKSAPELVSSSEQRSDEHYRYMQWLCGSQGMDTNLSCEGDEVVVLA